MRAVHSYSICVVLTLLISPRTLIAEASGDLRNSEDTTPIVFSVGAVNYIVPRNYISQMNDYGGGPQEMVTFKVTYPGFEPLTDRTRECLSSAAEYLAAGPGCHALTFWIDGVGSGMPLLSDDDRFNNATRNVNAPTVKQTPGGLTLYQWGSGSRRSDIYRKKTKFHNLLITCNYFDKHGKPDAICSNYYSLILGAKNSLSYRLNVHQVKNAEEIDDGIRLLISSFVAKGN